MPKLRTYRAQVMASLLGRNHSLAFSAQDETAVAAAFNNFEMASRCADRIMLRSFSDSDEAENAGFSRMQWLRAFSFAERAARQDAENALPKWWHIENGFN